MKKFFLILAAFITAVSCKENPDAPSISSENNDSDSRYVMTLNEAQELLEQILNDMSAETKSGQPTAKRTVCYAYSTGSPSETKAGEEAEPYVHIFNFDDNGGFAIMSADKRVPPLLALTFDGELAPDTEVSNPGLINFLANAERYYKSKTSGIGLGDIGGIVVFPGETIRYSHVDKFIYDMNYGHCQVRWGQRAPYNKYCPYIDGKPTLTGCVTTAVAQLMSVYRYPASYNGHTFNWSLMNSLTDKYLPNPDLEAESQVARLMQQLGLSSNLDVDYGTNSSPAPSENIPRTLENFGYSNGGRFVDYSTTEVVNELSAGYYVLISGFSYRTTTKSTILGIPVNDSYGYSSGHQWLAHGLMKEKHTVDTYVCVDTNEFRYVSTDVKNYWYILCNMGWNGDDDGYYLSEVFDTNDGPEYEWEPGQFAANTKSTEGESHNYQFYQKAIIGIRK